MLDIEEPNPRRRAEEDNRQVHDEERQEADSPNQEGDRGENPGVGRHRADPGRRALPHEAEGKAVLEYEEKRRAEAEHHEGMAIEPIANPPPAAAGEIFPHRQRYDVADAAAVEIAGSRVMNRMGPPPMIVGGQSEDCDDAAGPVVCRPTRKERAMAAIMLNHEKANQQA